MVHRSDSLSFFLALGGETAGEPHYENASVKPDISWTMPVRGRAGSCDLRAAINRPPTSYLYFQVLFWKDKTRLLSVDRLPFLKLFLIVGSIIKLLSIRCNVPVYRFNFQQRIFLRQQKSVISRVINNRNTFSLIFLQRRSVLKFDSNISSRIDTFTV